MLGCWKEEKVMIQCPVVRYTEPTNTFEASPLRLTSLIKIDTTDLSNKNPNCKRIGAQIE